LEEQRKGVVWLGDLHFRTAVWFTDTRDQAEITYRIEVGRDGEGLVKIGENAGNPWVKWGWIAAAVLVPVGIVGLGLWQVRRVRRSPTPGRRNN